MEFHDADTETDTDIRARILADTSDTHDFLKLFLWQAERQADILATILARKSVSVSWNALSGRWYLSVTNRRSIEMAAQIKLVSGVPTLCCNGGGCLQE